MQTLIWRQNINSFYMNFPSFSDIASALLGLCKPAEAAARWERSFRHSETNKRQRLQLSRSRNPPGPQDPAFSIPHTPLKATRSVAPRHACHPPSPGEAPLAHTALHDMHPNPGGTHEEERKLQENDRWSRICSVELRSFLQQLHVKLQQERIFSIKFFRLFNDSIKSICSFLQVFSETFSCVFQVSFE